MPAIRKTVELFARYLQPDGPIIEIGSYYPPGNAYVSDFRPLFPGRKFIGCDIRDGEGVDQIENAEELTFRSDFAGTILMMDVLEHLRNPWTAVSEAHRVLRKDGLLLISVPFDYRIHGWPSDYWRFTAAGLYHLLREFPQRAVFSVGPFHKPEHVFALVSKSRDVSMFPPAVRALFKSHWEGTWITLQERMREFFGFVLGRANWGVTVFDPREADYYRLPERQVTHQ